MFHISTENSFVAETVLRKHFKKVSNVYWKRCHGKNTVKNKLGEMVDVLFVCSNSINAIFNMQYVPISENSVWAFKNKDERGSYSLGALKHDRTLFKYATIIIAQHGASLANTVWCLQCKLVIEYITMNNMWYKRFHQFSDAWITDHYESHYISVNIPKTISILNKFLELQTQCKSFIGEKLTNNKCFFLKNKHVIQRVNSKRNIKK